jgi:hypothetical protein
MDERLFRSVELAYHWAAAVAACPDLSDDKRELLAMFSRKLRGLKGVRSQGNRGEIRGF